MDGQLTLCPVTENDLPLLQRLYSDPRASGEHEWHGWQDTRWLRREWVENGLLGGDGGTLMARRGDDALGFVAWRRRSYGPHSYTWIISIGMKPEARGHGHGSEAQRQLARYLFAHTQANRVEAGTEITNVAEQRALEKAGFTREGVLRGALFRQGQWHDCVIYGVLRGEVDLSSGEEQPAGS
ncbi:MAG: GNAT family N-acetyltransferase [Streptosporangiaceae bacterium]